MASLWLVELILTQMKVPGRKTIVITAIVFIEELSRNVASAIYCIFKLSLLEDSATLILA
jgi:hypothetical protein